jgi:hypothetical protein
MAEHTCIEQCLYIAMDRLYVAFNAARSFTD